MQSILTFSNLGKQGRLGNQLFQIMAAIGTARRLNLKLQLPFLDPKYRSYFFTEEDFFSDSIPTVTHRYDEPHFHYKPIALDEFIALPNYKEGEPKVYDITGYYQTDLYWECTPEEFKRYFKFFFEENALWRKEFCYPAHGDAYGYKYSLHHISPKKIEQNTTKKCLVAVHVRGTDYLDPEGIFANINAKQYYKSIQLLRSYFKSENKPEQLGSIIFFSDDFNLLRAVQTEIKDLDAELYYSKLLYSVSKSDVEDLYFMSQCDSFVMANSSFSWWAMAIGYYKMLFEIKEGKRDGVYCVIRPKQWFNQKGAYNNTKDLFTILDKTRLV